jgi:hypothetical protein
VVDRAIEAPGAAELDRGVCAREGSKRVLFGLRDRRRHFNRLDNGRIVIFRFVDACRDRPHPHRLGWERLHQITRIRIVT